MRPFIIPIFIPNLACPHRCVFCEQRRITSEDEEFPTPEKVRSVIETALRSKKFNADHGAQLAFYGGTFTGIPFPLMEALLSTTKPYLDNGYIRCIRASTRPDFVDLDRLQFIKKYGVKIVELGAQSMDNRVLDASHRGHTSEDTVAAVKRLRQFGFSVGIQLMPGLPEDTKQAFYETVSKVLELQPDFVRIYPTVVIEGTLLAKYYREGRYTPLSLETAITMCADAVESFEANGIKVIRVGLMSSPSLLQKGQIVAGPWHPSFGQLVRSEIYHRRIRKMLPAPGVAKTLEIRANVNEIPLLRGYRNAGIRNIKRATGASVVSIKGDAKIEKGKVEVKII